jgi:hypothetical protein
VDGLKENILPLLEKHRQGQDLHFVIHDLISIALGALDSNYK